MLVDENLESGVWTALQRLAAAPAAATGARPRGLLLQWLLSLHLPAGWLPRPEPFGATRRAESRAGRGRPGEGAAPGQETPRASVLDLPADVLELILEALSPQRVLWGPALACRLLRRAAQRPRLWKRLYTRRWPRDRLGPVRRGRGGARPLDWRRLYINRKAASLRLRRKSKRGREAWDRRTGKRKRWSHNVCPMLGCAKLVARDKVAAHLLSCHGVEDAALAPRVSTLL